MSRGSAPARRMPEGATHFAICACGQRVAIFDGEPHHSHTRGRHHRAWAEEQALRQCKTVTRDEVMTALEGKAG